MAITIAREPADSPEAAAVLQARDIDSAGLYPVETDFSIPAEDHARDEVLFFMLRENGAPIGCGAIEKHENYAEMKSVFLLPPARGKRLGQVIIGKLEEVARGLGYEEVRLETGNLSPWAIKAYERAGYSICERFGDYPENAYSVFMTKRLEPHAILEGDQP
jgi:putative acetyltransferase